jgi:hypothetical protein
MLVTHRSVQGDGEPYINDEPQPLQRQAGLYNGRIVSFARGVYAPSPGYTLLPLTRPLAVGLT